MAVQLHSLENTRGVTKGMKRVGRGNGSGRGTYAGRGLKGQRSRSGGKKGLKLKGFKQNLLNLPKFKGMNSPKPAKQTITLTQLQKHFVAGDLVNPQVLVDKDVIKVAGWVKIVSSGTLSIALSVSGCDASATAQAAIEKAGGTFAIPSFKTKRQA